MSFMLEKKREKQNPARVIIPHGSQKQPDPHELDVAYILAQHYKTTVKFIVPVDDYKRKSADILMNGVEWEIKSPRGNGKSTISNQLRNASKQSCSIVIDSRLTELTYGEVEKRVRFSIQNKSVIKRVILINKFGKVVEIR
jgi:hypothetical protein